MKRLAIISTHPIQYNAPLYKLLHQRNKIAIKVFYTWGEAVLEKKFDPGFGKVIEWDIPLLEGYDYEFVENVATDPGSHHFKGIDNPALVQRIEAWKADALLVYGWSYRSHLDAMRYFKGKIPILFRGDSTLLDKRGWLKGLVRTLFLKLVYRNIDRALYVGEANKDYFLRHSVPASKLRWAPHVIDNARFSSDAAQYEKDAIAWKAQMGIPAGAIVFLYAGKFEPKKDPLLLLEAFKSMNRKDCFLVLAGNGLLEQSLKKQAGSDKNILFIDFVNQKRMPVLYRIADVFVLASKGPGETWGLAVNEAMACGRAVIVSDHCGCASDLVQEGKNGYVFESGSVSSLQKAMEQTLEKPQRAGQMGAASAEIIWTWDVEAVASVIEQETLELTNNYV